MPSPRPVDGERWTLIGDRFKLPGGTRKIVLRFASTRVGGGGDARMDNAVLSIQSESTGADIGAGGIKDGAILELNASDFRELVSLLIKDL